MMGYGGWGMGGFGGIGMILFWIVLILAIVWLVRALDQGRSQTGGRNESSERDDRALDILRERYARGEIDSDEFERRKSELTRKDTT
ncbi:MAG: SHOCT domain-containing protein [Trueperaceae bacterium]|nr:SHOCT domain-containing protein [Trueperaceae bacterium]